MIGPTTEAVIGVITISQTQDCLIFSFLFALSFYTLDPLSLPAGGHCRKCALCLCKARCTQISSSIHLSAVLDCTLKASRWLWVCFSCRGGERILSVWSCRQKYGQHNRISFLVSAFPPHCDILLGTHFCCANHIQISAGRFLSERGRRKMEEGGVKEEKKKDSLEYEIW